MKAWLLIGLLLVIGQAQAQPVPAIASLLRQVSGDSLRKTVVEVSGVVPVWVDGRQETIGSRQYNTPGNETAFAYLRNRLLSYGCTVDSQAFSATGTNLVAIFQGADTGTVVLLGAHYDNIGYPVGQGADDNASGVAAVLECARLCTRNRFAKTVVLAFWDEEEPGAIGSAAFLQWPRLMGKDVAGYVNLDMIGWDGNGDSVAEVHTRPSGQSLAWAARALDLNADYGIGLQLQTVNPGNAATDVGPFWQAGSTAIGFGEDYDSDPYPYRHSPDDTVGNLSFGYLAKQTRLALATVLHFAGLQPMAVAAPEAHPSRYQPAPNPFRDALRVDLSDLRSQPVSVTLTDATGRVVYQTAALGGGVLQVDTRQWPEGVYLLRIAADGSTHTHRLVRAGR